MPEVPQSIKRMTIGEYNELVVPLAFTTLIENYEENVPEDELQDGAQGNDDDDLSSKGFNSEEEAEEDSWLSESAVSANKNLSATNLSNYNLHTNGNMLSSLAGTLPLYIVLFCVIVNDLLSIPFPRVSLISFHCSAYIVHILFYYTQMLTFTFSFFSLSYSPAFRLSVCLSFQAKCQATVTSSARASARTRTAMCWAICAGAVAAAASARLSSAAGAALGV